MTRADRIAHRLALGAALMLGVSGFPAQGSARMMSLCTEQGIRLVAIPDAPGQPKAPNDCAKACHALCERKRSKS